MQKIHLLFKSFFLVSVLSIITSFTIHAQFAVAGKSASFEEPQTGVAKILMLKDGSTFFYHLQKSMLKIKCFDPSYKQIVSKPVQHGLGILRLPDIAGCFEIDGNVVLFLNEYDKLERVLHRLVINPKTGDTVSVGTLGKLDPTGLAEGYANIFGGVPVSSFTIAKDPYSDNYALAFVNSFEKERNKRIEVIHYNNKHQEISRAFMSSPEDKFKYIRIRDLVVIGDKQVMTLIYAYNTRRSGGKEDDVLIASFSNNDKDVQYTLIPVDDGFTLGRGLLKYNPVTKKVLAVTTYEISRRVRKDLDIEPGDMEYALQVHIVDPNTKNVMKGPLMKGNDVNAKYKELFGKRKNYSGLLQNFFINKDGGYTIILEGYEEYTITSSQSSFTRQEYHFTDIAVLNYNQSGNSIGGNLIPKDYIINTSIMTGGGMISNYHASRDWTGIDLGGGNQYKLFAYFEGKDNRYILFNDIEENEKKILKRGKVTDIRGLGECDAFAFQTNSTEVFPRRKFLFGEPDGKREHNLALLAVSDYDKERNIFATLKLEIDGRDKKVRLVWLKLD